MTSEQWLQLKEIFHEATLLAPRARSAFLHERCDGDAEMLHELQLLLESHDEAADFIEQPALASASEIFSLDGKDFWIGRTIGRYRILSEIGRGGMGVVYLAVRDDDEYRKQAAIKLIKRGMDTDAVLSRFRHERQILANLEHPNIARLLDGGTSEDGLPYFVMEYVEGEPIDRYCDSRALSTEERLELFRQVCAAVTYAHQNLVIHRDLKPINILVTSDGAPKLLDFGIAKVLSSDGREATATAVALRALTPEYASPEQLRGEKLTTATDVYSLGVILYELLTGQRPYETEENSPADLLRVMEKSEPTRPSKIGFDLRSQRRRSPASRDTVEPATFAPSARLPRGDLDNIVLKALSRDSTLRYKSVEQLTEDIERCLKGLPVSARAATLRYRAAKFIGRNRAGVAAALLVLLSLLVGVAATVWQARRAREQARIAEQQRDRAREAQARAEKINRFMQTIFSYANPEWFGRAGGRRDMSVLDAMRDIEKHIDTDFRDEPDLRADVYQQIGDSYRTQGLYADAERNLREALRLRLELYGEDSVKVAESLYILSGVRYQQGDVAEQASLLTRALTIQRRHPHEGNNLPYMMVDYATLLFEAKNDFAGALALDREALEDFRRRYGEDHYMIGETQAALAESYSALGDYEQAEALIQEYLKRHPPSHFSILHCRAWAQMYRGDYRQAEETIKQMLALAQSTGRKPSEVAFIQDTQSAMAYLQGDYAQAKAYAEKALAAQADANARYYRISAVARCLNKLGQPQRAEILLREPIERPDKPEQVFNLAILKSVLGESLAAQRRFAEAETFLLEAYETQKARVLPQQYNLVETRRRLADLYRAWDKPYEAGKY